MGQLLSGEQQVPEKPFEEVFEEKKAEVVAKLGNFIGKGLSARPAASVTALTAPHPGAADVKGVPTPVAPPNTWTDQLGASKAQALRSLKDRPVDAGALYEPLTQEEVGKEVEAAMGPTFGTFSTYQGTITHAIEQGLDDRFLEQFTFLDDDSERALTTFEKWAVIKHAAEQVLQVYMNRSNARLAEEERWEAPPIMDVRTGIASAYLSTVETAFNQGSLALALIDDGRLVETGSTTAAAEPLLCVDLWRAMKKVAPHKVPSGQRLERLSVMGRHLLSVTVALETKYGANAARLLKVVLAFDGQQEQAVVAELTRWGFFGLQPEHVALLPLPRFHGFAQDMKRNTLAHVKGSPRLLLGTGYALYLMASPAEAYVLDASGSPTCLPGSVLDWLKDGKANWLMTRLASDLEVLRKPDAALDLDFLSGAVFCADRGGANMAMDVRLTTSEPEARRANSVVLAHAGSATGNGASCVTLPVSAMRTVQSWQLMKAQVADPRGFHIATQRYVFKVGALQRLLTDPGNLRADVHLHGFYAYAALDLGTLTTLKGAHCAAVLARNAPGPDMIEPVFTRNWLVQAAGVLQEQDKVDAFRQRAIGLIRLETLNNSKKIQSLSGSLLRPRASLPDAPDGGSALPGHTALKAAPSFKERKAGLTIVMLLSGEHRGLASTALKLSRQFVHNIVDRLHVVVVLSGLDAAGGAEAAKQLLADVSDKELEFNGQLSREVLTRPDPGMMVDTLRDLLALQSAGLVVVPSLKLSGATGDLGSMNASLALTVAKSITSCSVLVVKANTVGRFASPLPSVAHSGAARDHMVAMAHLDSTVVAPMVEAVSNTVLTPGRDVLFLARTSAYERLGTGAVLSMRTRRLFVQARMAVAPNLRLEERAFAGPAVPELCKAVEAEAVDLLVVSTAGELVISREVEDLLRTAKTSILIQRTKDVAPNASLTGVPTLVIEEPPPSVGYVYSPHGR